jgi:hypothetical protein
MIGFLYGMSYVVFTLVGCLCIFVLIQSFINTRRYKKAMLHNAALDDEMDRRLYEARLARELDERIAANEKEYEDALRGIEIYERLFQEGNSHDHSQEVERGSTKD